MEADRGIAVHSTREPILLGNLEGGGHMQQMHPSFIRRAVQAGLILLTVRLSVIWSIVILERIIHPGYGFLALFIPIALVFFPEGLLLDGWIKSPIALSGIVVLTSFPVAAFWLHISTPPQSVSN